MLALQTDINIAIYTQQHFVDCCIYIHGKLDRPCPFVHDIERLLTSLLGFNSIKALNEHLKSTPLNKEITISKDIISLSLNSLNIKNIENTSHTLFILLRRNPPELLYAPEMNFSEFLGDCSDYTFNSPTEQSPSGNKQKLVDFIKRLESSKNHEYLEEKCDLFRGGSDIELWSTSISDINDLNIRTYFEDKYSKNAHVLFWRTKFNKVHTYRDIFHHSDTIHCIQLIHVAILHKQNIKPLGIVKGETFDIGGYSSLDIVKSEMRSSEYKFLSRDMKNYLNILAKYKELALEQLIETMRFKNQTVITYINDIYSSDNMFEKCIIASSLSSKSHCDRNRPRKRISEGKLTLFPKLNKAYSLVIFNKKLEMNTYIMKLLYTEEDLEKEKLIEEKKFEQKTLFIRTLSNYIGRTNIIENETLV